MAIQKTTTSGKNLTNEQEQTSSPTNQNIDQDNTKEQSAKLAKENIRKSIYLNHSPKSIYTLRDITFTPKNSGLNILRSPLNIPRLYITEYQPEKLMDIAREFVNMYKKFREGGSAMTTVLGMSTPLISGVVGGIQLAKGHPLKALASFKLRGTAAVLGIAGNPYQYQAQKSSESRLKEMFGLPLDNFKEIILKDTVATYEFPYFGDSTIIDSDGNVGWSKAKSDISSGDILAMIAQTKKLVAFSAMAVILARIPGARSLAVHFGKKAIMQIGNVVKSPSGFGQNTPGATLYDKMTSQKGMSEYVEKFTPINFPPVREWNFEDRRKSVGQPVNVTFTLNNESIDDLKKNFQFMVSLITGGMWLQVNDVMYSQNLYRVRYPGKFDHIYCTMELRIRTKGSLRKLNSVDALRKFYSDVNLKTIIQSTIARDYGMEFFPDGYELDFVFQPLLPNNFNSHINAIMNNNWETVGVFARNFTT